MTEEEGRAAETEVSAQTERSEGVPRPVRRPRRPARFRQQRRRRVCSFCAEKIDHIDYKNVDLLSRSLTDRGRLRGRRRTGTCAKHQRRLAVAVKRARHLALLPFGAEHVRSG